MIQVLNTLGVFIKEFAFPRYRLSCFDQVQDDDRCSVSFEQVIEMPRGRGEERIYDADWHAR